MFKASSASYLSLLVAWPRQSPVCGAVLGGVAVLAARQAAVALGMCGVRTLLELLVESTRLLCKGKRSCLESDIHTNLCSADSNPLHNTASPAQLVYWINIYIFDLHSDIDYYLQIFSPLSKMYNSTRQMNLFSNVLDQTLDKYTSK
jgi:hypothetical protein